MKNNKIIFIIFFFTLVSCEKDETIKYLLNGKWKIDWVELGTHEIPEDDFHYVGKVDFKKNGTGIFYPEDENTKVPFNYTIDYDKATWQWEHPKVRNKVDSFYIVIAEEDYQVWEQLESFSASTLVLEK